MLICRHHGDIISKTIKVKTLDRKYEIYPETREADRPVWKTERLKKRKRNSILSRFPGIEDAAQFFGQGFDPMGFLQEAGRAVGQQVVDRGR